MVPGATGGLPHQSADWFAMTCRVRGCPMVTYSDLIQLGILIVGIIGLFVQIKKK